MKRLLFTTVLGFLFIGCGSTTTVESGSVDKEDTTLTSTPPKVPEKSYRFYDYLGPSSNLVVTTYKYTNSTFKYEEPLEYRYTEGLLTERSLENLDGQVEYHDAGDTIDVTIYQGSDISAFKMHNYVDIGDMVTIKKSSCNITNHLATLTLGDKAFKDVLEVSCPKSVGYYQKSRGLIMENRKEETLQSNALNALALYPDRKLAIVDGDKRDRHLSVFNLESAKMANVSKLWSYPYYLNGEGMKIGLVDEGSVLDYHVELTGRVTNLSPMDTNLHATHVAGTLIASGINSKAHGFANQATLLSYSYSQYAFAKSIVKLAENDVLISNHSYGYEGPIGIGEYDGISRDMDREIRNNPYIIAVVAAGNDGEKYKEDSDYTKWGLIKGGSNAKNVITVGALEDDGKTVASFSSSGPVERGRIKPDIVMDGTKILSTNEESDGEGYSWMSGTSMATPAATGAVTLLAQRYKEIHHSNIRLDTMKAILYNSAKDVDNIGPDYKSGYGLVDAEAAVKVINSMQDSSSSLVKLDSIHQGENQTYFINSERYQDFKVTLAWVDDIYQDCNNCANDMLINDIDIYLLDENTGEKIYPYTLDPKEPWREAVKTKENHLDPQEQISYRLRPGNYSLHLHGYKIGRRGQNFTLVSSMALSDAKKDIVLMPLDEHIHKIYNAIE
jgi:subtilisin family serine protease